MTDTSTDLLAPVAAPDTPSQSSPSANFSNNFNQILPAELGFGKRVRRPADAHNALEEAKLEDAKDAKADGVAFVLKVRRAHRLCSLKQEKVHRELKLTWVAFCDTHFSPGGYDTWVRYQAAAKALHQLWRWELPLPNNAETVRIIIPGLNAPGARECLTKLVEAHKGFPRGHELVTELARLARPRARKPATPNARTLIRYLSALEQSSCRFHATEIAAFRDARLRLAAQQSEAALKAEPLFQKAQKEN